MLGLVGNILLSYFKGGHNFFFGGGISCYSKFYIVLSLSHLCREKCILIKPTHSHDFLSIQQGWFISCLCWCNLSEKKAFIIIIHTSSSSAKTKMFRRYENKIPVMFPFQNNPNWQKTIMCGGTCGKFSRVSHVTCT
jgi:hypothetical protein